MPVTIHQLVNAYGAADTLFCCDPRRLGGVGGGFVLMLAQEVYTNKHAAINQVIYTASDATRKQCSFAVIPEEPYTTYLTTLVPETMPGMFVGTRVSEQVVYGPFGYIFIAKPICHCSIPSCSELPVSSTETLRTCSRGIKILRMPCVLTCMPACMHVCMYVCFQVCMHVYTWTYLFICMCICKYTCMYMHM